MMYGVLWMIRKMIMFHPVKLVWFTEWYLRRCRKSKDYRASLKSLVNVLREFEAYTGKELYTVSFTSMRCEEFIFFLETNKHLRNNSIRNIIGRLITVHNVAHKEGYMARHYLKRPRAEDSGMVALSEPELWRIHKMKVEGSQKDVKNFFLICSFTAFRKGDYPLLNPAQIRDEVLEKKASKTLGMSYVPLHPIVMEILAEYDYQFPKVDVTSQWCNQVLKSICKQAGITELVVREFRKGGKLVQECRPKWELVTTHTARRSAITNLYLRNTPLATIMTLSGHQSINSLFRYIRVAKEEHLRILKRIVARQGADYYLQEKQEKILNSSNQKKIIKYYQIRRNRINKNRVA